MANVGLDGSDNDRVVDRPSGTYRLGDGLELSPVTGLCAGSMTFDISCLIKFQTR